MYAFPRVTVPAGAIAHASEQNTTADSLYALSLLDATGICVVPASGFGQAENRVGFRTTFLPSEEELAIAVERIAEHHVAFTQKWVATA